jgi:hypothetical protein
MNTVKLKVKTEGGLENGAVCSYSFSGYNNMIQFYNTGSNIHEQEVNLNAGHWIVK